MRVLILLFVLFLVSCDSSCLYGKSIYRSVSPCVGTYTRFSNGYTNWSVLDCGDSLIMSPSNVVVLPEGIYL